MPNLYEIFIWKSLSLLRKDARFSFIVPDRLCANQQFIKLRQRILEEFSLKKLWLKVPFPGIIADTVIFNIENKKSKSIDIEITEYPENKIIYTSTDVFLASSDKAFFYVRKDIFKIFEKIKTKNNFKTLENLALTTSGCGAKSSEITKEKKNKQQIPILKGESISRYKLRNHFWFEFIDENLSGRTRDRNKLGKKFKVLLRKTGSDLIATFDDTGNYPEQSLYFLFHENDDNKTTLLFLLAVLNSKLINCYYKNFAVTNRDSTPQLKNINLNKFPIVMPDNFEPFVKIVEKMLSLNKNFNNLKGQHSNEFQRLKIEIEKTDAEIDRLVYELYGLTEEEIKIVEESLK